MKNYRALCRFLREEYGKRYKFTFRRCDLGGDYGKCDLADGRFIIRVGHQLCEGGAVLVALHEMAHVVSWHTDRAPSQHGPEFGHAYHLVWESYLKYLGRSAAGKGARMAAKKVLLSQSSHKPVSLRERALSRASEFVRRKKTLLEQLREQDPEMHAELVQLIEDWKKGDRELRAAYPSKRSFAAFLESATAQAPVLISYSCFREYLR